MKAIYDEVETELKWQNDMFDPPTLSWNINVKDDSPALNVTAGKTVCSMYLRPMPGIDVDPLLTRVRQAGERHDVHCANQPLGKYFFCQSQFGLCSRFTAAGPSAEIENGFVWNRRWDIHGGCRQNCFWPGKH